MWGFAMHLLCLAPLARAQSISEVAPYASPRPSSLTFAASSAQVVLVEERAPGAISVFSEVREREQRELDPDGVLSNELARGPEQQHTISETELRHWLEARIARRLSGQGDSLEFRVRILAVEGRDELAEHTEARLEILARRDDRELAVVHSSSRLTGHLGGQTAGIPQRLLACVLDAFERGALSDGFIAATNQRLAQTAVNAEADADAHELPAVTSKARVDHHDLSADAHVAGVALDFGLASDRLPDPGYALGVRYLWDRMNLHRGVSWWGFGGEVRGLSCDFASLQAAAGLALLRGGFGFEQGVNAELGVGAIAGDRPGGLALVGLYWSFYYLDIGATGQVPFAPGGSTEWLTGFNVGVRLYVPFASGSASVERRSPLPITRADLNPGFRPDHHEMFESPPP